MAAIEGDPDHGPLDRPGPDSPFEPARQYDGVCRCKGCRALVWSNPESREAHLNRAGCHAGEGAT